MQTMIDEYLTARRRGGWLPHLVWFGFGLSLAVHLTTFGGIDVSAAAPIVWALHVGAIAAFAAALWAARAVHTRDVLTLRILPPWARLAVVVALAYGMINFALFLQLSEGAAPERTATGFVLSDHGRILRVLTEWEYWQQRAYVLRGFSGHWMCFFAIAALFLQYTTGRSAVALKSLPHADSAPPRGAVAVPRVRMWIRVALIIALFFGGAFAFILDAAQTGRWGVPGAVWLFGWVALMGLLQVALLRCPHCGKLAVRTPTGWSTPFVGTTCRWCEKPY